MPWMMFVGLLVVVLVAAIGIVWWRVWHRKRALQLLIRRGHGITDTQVAAAMAALGAAAPAASLPVADVWGHGIMAFAYTVADPQAELTRAAVATALSEQAQAAGFTPLSPRYAPFEVTDWWQRGGETHFDVAYVANAATSEYVGDVAKVS